MPLTRVFYPGFSLTAESGKLYAVVNGFKRDAASLSGGERAIVAL